MKLTILPFYPKYVKHDFKHFTFGILPGLTFQYRIDLEFPEYSYYSFNLFWLFWSIELKLFPN